VARLSLKVHSSGLKSVLITNLVNVKNLHNTNVTNITTKVVNSSFIP